MKPAFLSRVCPGATRADGVRFRRTLPNDCKVAYGCLGKDLPAFAPNCKGFGSGGRYVPLPFNTVLWGVLGEPLPCLPGICLIGLNMVSATPRISNATLASMLRGGRFSLGNRIVFSFGVLFVLMVVMAVVSYDRLRVIDEEAVSLERDSVPGLYLATALRGATRNSHATLERALFVDADAATANRDLERAAQSVRELDQHSAAYEATIFREDDRQRFRAYRAVVDKYLPMFNEAM